MQRGRVGTQVALLGQDGRPLPDALYRAPLELRTGPTVVPRFTA